MVIDHRREQIIRRGDRVKIAREMQIDLIHRHDLSVAAARRTAFHAETGAQAWLTQTDRRALADAIERVAQTDGRCRLALTRGRWADAGDQDQRAVLFFTR